MFVSDLALDRFRSYREVVLHFEPGATIFLGANGQGKTNLLEALNYLAVLSSHRVGSDAALIFRGATKVNSLGFPTTAGVIRARVHAGDSLNPLMIDENPANSETEDNPGNDPGRLLEIELVAGRANRAMVNRHAVRPRALIGQLATVMFAPEDLELVRGDPARRRDFLDNIAIQLKPALSATFSEYTKVTRQRGAYLKDVAKRRGTVDEFQLGVWDEALVPLAAQIMVARADIVSRLGALIPGIYAKIAKGEPEVGLGYEDSVSKTLEIDPGEWHKDRENTALWEEKIFSALRARRSDEARRGVNLVGPHRDELGLYLHGFPVKGYASHGESWSFALALRLAQFYLLRDVLEDTPVLLLDDVFAELDEHRRSAMLDAIAEADQVFVTSAVGTEIPEELEGEFFRVTLDPENRESAVQQLGRGVASNILG